VAAAKRIYRKCLGRFLSQKFMNVNTRGSAVLAGMKLSIKEAIDKTKAVELRSSELEIRQKKKTEEWVATM